MEALVNNLKVMFANVYQANVTNINFSMRDDYQHIYGMNGLVGYQPGNIITTLQITIEEDKPIFADDIRTARFNNVVRDSAVLQNMRVTKSFIISAYVTELEFYIIDVDKFSTSVKDYEWAMYSNKFDNLMEKKLSE